MKKKVLIVYYSFEGNCDWVAKQIQEFTGGDLLELKPVNEKKPTGFSKFLWGGRQVIMGEKPELEKITVDFDSYDLIILGTPVWAWSPTPVVKSFLDQKQFRNWKMALFCCHGGGKGKTLEKLKNRLSGNEIIGEIDFWEPVKKNKQAETQEKIKNWLNKIGVVNE